MYVSYFFVFLCGVIFSHFLHLTWNILRKRYPPTWRSKAEEAFVVPNREDLWITRRSILGLALLGIAGLTWGIVFIRWFL